MIFYAFTRNLKIQRYKKENVCTTRKYIKCIKRVFLLKSYFYSYVHKNINFHQNPQSDNKNLYCWRIHHLLSNQLQKTHGFSLARWHHVQKLTSFKKQNFSPNEEPHLCSADSMLTNCYVFFHQNISRIMKQFVFLYNVIVLAPINEDIITIGELGQKDISSRAEKMRTKRIVGSKRNSIHVKFLLLPRQFVYEVAFKAIHFLGCCIPSIVLAASRHKFPPNRFLISCYCSCLNEQSV